MLNKKGIDMLLTDTLLIADKFNNIIEFNRHKFDNYLETILNYCIEYNMEMIHVKKLLNPQILSKMTAECESDNLITRTSNTVSLFD
jgi:hypothetical protein